MRNKNHIYSFSECMILDELNLFYKNAYFVIIGPMFTYYPNYEKLFRRDFFLFNDENFKETFQKWI